MPTASISSMNTMQVPPHLRARRRALRMRNITTMTSMPMNVCANPDPGIVTIGALNVVAMPLESIVLPVPGAPMKSRPRSGLTPALRNSSPADHSSMTFVTSALGSDCPRTSSSLTPQSASPGPVDARPRDQLVRDNVDQPAERDDEGDRGKQRPDDRPAVDAGEDDERHRRRQKRDEGRSACEPPPFLRQRFTLRRALRAGPG